MFTFFKSINRSGQITESATTTTQSSDYVYEVKKGDSLWKIAEKEYGNGFEWKKIAEANDLENPNIIEPGTKLTLPEPERQEIQEYTVQKGDSLWTIAQAQCGSGYAWVEIARQNGLKNPAVIHRGNVLRIDCKKL